MKRVLKRIAAPDKKRRSRRLPFSTQWTEKIPFAAESRLPRTPQFRPPVATTNSNQSLFSSMREHRRRLFSISTNTRRLIPPARRVSGRSTANWISGFARKACTTAITFRILLNVAGIHCSQACHIIFFAWDGTGRRVSSWVASGTSLFLVPMMQVIWVSLIISMSTALLA